MYEREENRKMQQTKFVKSIHLMQMFQFHTQNLKCNAK